MRFAVINTSGERTEGQAPMWGRVVSLHDTLVEAWEHSSWARHITVGYVTDLAEVHARVAYAPANFEARSAYPQ